MKPFAFIVSSAFLVSGVALLFYIRKKLLQKKFSEAFYKFSLNTYKCWFGLELTSDIKENSPKGIVYYLDF